MKKELDREEVIDKLWENSNHGTNREDIVAAYEAGKKAAEKQLKTARELLERSVDEIPAHMDGRNDRLINAIEKWIETYDEH